MAMGQLAMARAMTTGAEPVARPEGGLSGP